jgi:1-acyl-sn-glycerol-3-phosphate acyltransferase
VRSLAGIAPGAAARGQRGITRAWARAAARVIGMRVRIEGAAAPGPSLLVANHLSYVDIVALWAAADGVFIAKSEVASWPLVGALGRLLGTLFVDRGRKRDLVRVIAAMQRELARGERVFLFAEGTSTRGERVLPFKSSLFEAAVRTGHPILCASLEYATPPGAAPADLSVCWWGDMTFPDHLYALLQLPRFDATVRFAPDALAGLDRKQLARRAHAVIESQWTPVVRAEAS